MNCNIENELFTYSGDLEKEQPVISQKGQVIRKISKKKVYLLKCSKTEFPELFDEIKDNMVVECRYNKKDNYFYSQN